MKTPSRRLLVFSVATLSIALRACSPVIYHPAPRPRPVVVAPPPPPPVQTVIVQPVIPVWAPPYQYVTEVHYYYFPEYAAYYNVVAQQYVYYNGYSWIPVMVLPYAGFNPYVANIIVLDRYATDPWLRHNYYVDQYPSGYLSRTYAPRQSMSSGVALRAYDENQSKPIFTDGSNRAVAVNYEVKSAPRTSAASRQTEPSSVTNAATQGVRTAQPSKQGQPVTTSARTAQPARQQPPVTTSPQRTAEPATRNMQPVDMTRSAIPQTSDPRQSYRSTSVPQQRTVQPQVQTRQQEVAPGRAGQAAPQSSPRTMSPSGNSSVRGMQQQRVAPSSSSSRESSQAPVRSSSREASATGTR